MNMESEFKVAAQSYREKKRKFLETLESKGIEFNLERAKKGDAVITRLGFPVRIISFDRVCPEGTEQIPIIALANVSNSFGEIVIEAREDGSQHSDQLDEFDLFMKE